jgi:UDP-N-acetylglucosamine 2-epimerase (non-hydrolysing)
MTLLLVGGARPNFVKLAPLLWELKENENFTPILVHTGQHYDYELSEVFFKELQLPSPDIYLGIGSGTHAEQVGKIMIRLEKVLNNILPEIVVVVGDVNSTLGTAITVSKWKTETGKNTLLLHIEAGLRSFDRMMPEELNRIIVDQLSDILFTHSIDANINLQKEGISSNKIHFVGNIMIDTLLKLLPQAKKRWKKRFQGWDYGILTLHRCENVDNTEKFASLLTIINEVAKKIPIIYPIHPRAKKMIEKLNLRNLFSEWDKTKTTTPGMYLSLPLGYLDFISLELGAKFVLTDSGGIQEETTVLGIPCLTLRKNTERPITITEGTNKLVGEEYSKIPYLVNEILTKNKNSSLSFPKYWDGMTAKRIIKILTSLVI